MTSEVCCSHCIAEIHRLDGELAKARAERDEAREAGGIIKWADDTRLSIKIAGERDAARAERVQLASILADVNAAINRSGIFCAITFPEAIDQVAAERDAARATVERLRAGRCLDVISSTLIACGEGGNFCSEACRLRSGIGGIIAALSSDVGMAGRDARRTAVEMLNALTGKEAP